MAPLDVKNVNAVFSVVVERSLGSSNATNLAPDLTHSQENALQCLALVFSTISVASSVLAFYWFMKMQRRIFKHDLIMLLIQSDMFKALWYMIYPIVVFIHGPVSSGSRFCQVNGFFIALGSEASDIAVLMIAIHSFLYIFRPKITPGGGGLFPYRKVAYAAWLVLPLLLASLAFINRQDSYVNEGTYCYLPVRPFWYRLALAWIPRYIIFIIILGFYAYIYFYVRYKFHGFTRLETISLSGEHIEKISTHFSPQSLPPTPALVCHGLIPDSRKVNTQDAGEVDNFDSTSEIIRRPPIISLASSQRITVETIKSPHISTPGSTNRFIWSNLIGVDDSMSSHTPSPELSPVDSNSVIAPTSSHQLPQIETTFPDSPREGRSIRILRSDSSGTSRRSMVDIILQNRPGEASTPISRIQLDLAVTEMLETRDKIRRQLRFLFIYPLVYIGMWILPFVSHIIQYDDKYAFNPPFGLTCVTTICVCSQAAVDCWLFSTREKPWKHIPDTNGKLLPSLKFWTGWKGCLKPRMKSGPGKTREEMTRAARAAYRRRDAEMAEQRREANQFGSQQDSKKKEISWWENTEDDVGTDMDPSSEDTTSAEDIVAAPKRRERVRFDLSDEERGEKCPSASRTASREGPISDRSST